jgi:hypothetical protein
MLWKQLDELVKALSQLCNKVRGGRAELEPT